MFSANGWLGSVTVGLAFRLASLISYKAQVPDEIMQIQNNANLICASGIMEAFSSRTGTRQAVWIIH